MFHTFQCENLILVSNTVQCQIYRCNSYIMRCIHLYTRSETSSMSIKFFKVTSGFLARSLKLNFMANMIFKGMRMKIILFYLDFLCRFYRAIILPQPNIRINMLYMLFLSQRFGWLNSSKTRVIRCQSNLDLRTVLKLRGSDHLASALFSFQ